MDPSASTFYIHRFVSRATCLDHHNPPVAPHVMDRRRDPKQLPTGFQERRRLAALDKQKHARKEAANRARKLALAATESTVEESEQDVDIQDASSAGDDTSEAANQQAEPTTPPSTAAANGQQRAPGVGKALRQYYAEQLMLPEWLIEVPPDLGAEWFVMPRPEGRRCLVISAKGQTTSRLRNGVLYERFASALPGGGPGTLASSDVFCILDCIYHEPNQTYYVIDLLCWKGYGLYDCSTEFRLYWVGSKLEETDAGQPPGSVPHHARCFTPIPAYRCTPEGLAAAHGNSVPFTRDGVYLLHREAHYSAGPTPLALLWKDAACSRYVIDTDAAGVPLAQQVAVLEYRMDGTVASADDPPAVLGRMPPAFIAQMGPRLRAGRLLRFRIGPAGIFFKDGMPAGADLHFEGPANQRRGRADSLSKIVFQHQARTSPITLQQLLAAAATGSRSVLQDEGAEGQLLLVGPGSAAASMSLVASEGREGGGSMLTDGGNAGAGSPGSDGVEVDMG